MASKIIFVDDEPKLQLIISQLFRREIRNGDFEVDFALNGREALNKLKTDPETDVVVTDINMPVMDGLALLAELKTLKHSFNPALTAIVLSAYGDMENIRKAMNAGAFDFLIKPMDFRDMRITLSKALGHAGQVRNALKQEQLARNALRKSEEKYRILFEYSNDAIIVTNPAGRITDSNSANWKVLGYSKAEMIKMTLSDLYSAHDDYLTFKIMLERKGAVENFESRFRKKDGTEIDCLVSAKKQWADNGTVLGFQNIIRDITKEKQAQEELKKHRDHLEELVKERTSELTRANEELENAKKYAESANRAKSEFLATMSHEIRTPMNAILGFSDILRKKSADPQQKNYLTSIHSSGKALLSLIDDILDLSKIEAGKLDIRPEPVDIRNLLNDIEPVFRHKFQEKGVAFEVETDPGIPRGLLLDEVRIRQILVNLIGNSIKFTHEGYVKVSVCCHHKNPDENFASITIEVEDTGIGIPEDQQELIFENFHQQSGQSTRQYGGTGLGLAITKRLAEMMGGKIFLQSTVGRGSSFRIVLSDIKITAPAEKESDEPANVSIEFEPASLLIVDDIYYNRDLIRSYLEDTNILFIEAESGEEALDLLNRYPVDLIVMDLRMPGKDGYEITEIIKKDDNLKHIPVIALTASVMRDVKEKTDGLFDGFLGKPVNEREFISALKQFLPYKSKPAPETAETECYPNAYLSEEVMDCLPQLIEILEHSFLPQWNEINEILMMDEVEQFAEKLRNVAREYNVQHLLNYANSLYENAQSYTVDKVENMVAHFPKLIHQMKDTIKDSGVLK